MFGITMLIGSLIPFAPPPFPPFVQSLLAINACLLTWRTGIRAAIVTHEYDWKEGLRSIPRTLISNIISIISARRAVAQYAKIKHFRDLKWDKTHHHFPEILP
jgi:bacteriophage N4 adsorption protein B